MDTTIDTIQVSVRIRENGLSVSHKVDIELSDLPALVAQLLATDKDIQVSVVRDMPRPRKATDVVKCIRYELDYRLAGRKQALKASEAK
jgi:hypothetical protein